MTWSSISRGLRPGQSVKTMTWFSLRSGIGVHRRVEHRVDAEHGQGRRHDQDDEPVADRALDQALDHGLPSGRIGGSFLNSATFLSVAFGSAWASSTQLLQQTNTGPPSRVSFDRLAHEPSGFS